MINRFLSMKVEWVDFVNEIQKYPISPKDLYRLYIDILPKGKQWLRYVKGRKEMEYPQWLLELVSKHYGVSNLESGEYLDRYYMTEQGKAELYSLLESYGTDPRQIETLHLR